MYGVQICTLIFCNYFLKERKKASLWGAKIWISTLKFPLKNWGSIILLPISI